MNKNVLLLSFSYVMYYSAIVLFRFNIGRLASPFGHDANHVEMMLILRSIFGFIGSVIVGIYLQKTRMYRLTSVMIGSLSAIFILSLVGTFRLGSGWSLVNSALIGFCLFPAYSMIFIYSSEVAYPLKETTTCGFFIMIAEVIGHAIAFTVFYVYRVKDELNSMIMIIIIAILVTLGAIISLFISPITHKKDHTAEENAKWNIN